MKLILAILLLASPVFAQDARVIPLSPIDAATAQAKYEALQKAQKDWDAFQERIKQDYLVVPKGDPEAGNTVIWNLTSGFTTFCADSAFGTVDNRDVDYEKAIAKCHADQKADEEKQEREHPTMYQRAGWENGFTFTKDFKFLVPKAAPEVRYNINTIPNVAW